MSYVSKEKNIKLVSLRLPDSLIGPFHEAASMFGVKERTLAAAVAYFCAADKDTKWAWYQKVSEFYGATSPNPPSDQAKPDEEAERLRDDMKKKVQRPPSQKQPRKAAGDGGNE